MHTRPISRIERDIKLLIIKLEKLDNTRPFPTTLYRNKLATLAKHHQELMTASLNKANKEGNKSSKIDLLNQAIENFQLAEEKLALINRHPPLSSKLNYLDALRELSLCDQHSTCIELIRDFITDPIFLADINELHNKRVSFEGDDLYYVAIKKVEFLHGFCQWQQRRIATKTQVEESRKRVRDEETPASPLKKARLALSYKFGETISFHFSMFPSPSPKTESETSQAADPSGKLEQ